MSEFLFYVRDFLLLYFGDFIDRSHFLLCKNLRLDENAVKRYMAITKVVILPLLPVDTYFSVHLLAPHLYIINLKENLLVDRLIKGLSNLKYFMYRFLNKTNFRYLSIAFTRFAAF